MTAGTGIRHSEFNPSDTDVVHFLQIWILPNSAGLEPGYEQKNFPTEEKQGRFRLVGSRDGRDGSVTIHQDVDLYATRLNQGERVSHALAANRKGWIHVARGSAVLDGNRLQAGDGVAVEGPATIGLTGASEVELLLFDMG